MVGKQGDCTPGTIRAAEEAESQVKGPDQVAWLDRLEAENDNLRTAIGGSLAAGAAQTAARFGWALRMYWLLRARQGEGRLLIEQTRAGRRPAGTDAGEGAQRVGGMHVRFGGRRAARRNIRGERRLLPAGRGRPRGGARAGMIGFAMLEMGNLDGATRIFGEVLENLKEQGDSWTSPTS